MRESFSLIAYRQLPEALRITSFDCTPLRGGGYQLGASLYHDQVSIEVAWKVRHPVTYFRPGLLVSPRCPHGTQFGSGVTNVSRVVRKERPVRTLDLFMTVPDVWVSDRDLLRRASNLWNQLPLPWQELFNNVLWDGNRFHLFCTGPSSIRGHHSVTNGNLLHMVEIGETVLALLPKFPAADPDVSLFAAMMHDVGKACEYQRNSSGGWILSDRGRLNGHKQTIGDWLAVAESRMRLAIPSAHYYSMRHAIGAANAVAFESGYRPPRTPEARLLSLADQVSGSSNLYFRQAMSQPGWGKSHPHLGGFAPYFLKGRPVND